MYYTEIKPGHKMLNIAASVQQHNLNTKNKTNKQNYYASVVMQNSIWAHYEQGYRLNVQRGEKNNASVSVKCHAVL